MDGKGSNMRLTFLGTGDVRQCPVFGCNCPACELARQDNRLRRKPTSALVQLGREKWLLDGGLMDLAERFAPGELSAILLTHFHVDHVQGLFHLRWGMGDKIPVYGPDDRNGCADLLKHPGILEFLPPLPALQATDLGDMQMTPIPLNHSKPTQGYLFSHQRQHLAYLTDTIGLPETSSQLLANLPDLKLVIDCTHPPAAAPRNHNSLTQVLEIQAALQPDCIWLTHISHEMDCWLLQNPLPDGMRVAQDGEAILL